MGGARPHGRRALLDPLELRERQLLQSDADVTPDRAQRFHEPMGKVIYTRTRLVDQIEFLALVTPTAIPTRPGRPGA